MTPWDQMQPCYGVQILLWSVMLWISEKASDHRKWPGRAFVSCAVSDAGTYFCGLHSVTLFHTMEDEGSNWICLFLIWHMWREMTSSLKLWISKLGAHCQPHTQTHSINSALKSGIAPHSLAPVLNRRAEGTWLLLAQLLGLGWFCVWREGDQLCTHYLRGQRTPTHEKSLWRLVGNPESIQTPEI